MTSARAMHSVARIVTSPRSPGPAPTRQTLPFCFLSLLLCIYFFQQLRGQFFRVFARSLHKTFARCRRPKSENLPADFHDWSIDNCHYSYRLIAIRIQQSQKLVLRPQSEPRVKIVDRIDDLSESFVARTDLHRNDTLSAGRDKNFPREQRRKKFAFFKLDARATWI